MAQKHVAADSTLPSLSSFLSSHAVAHVDMEQLVAQPQRQWQHASVAAAACALHDRFATERLHRYSRPSHATGLDEGSNSSLDIRNVPAHEQAIPRSVTRFTTHTISKWDDALTPELLDNATARFESSERWRTLAALRKLNLVVLGTSPTSGCGSVIPTDPSGEEILHNQTTNASVVCNGARSWARQLFDNLQRLHTPLRFSIFFKNAVSFTFFGQCASSRVPADTSVILVEVGCSVWDSETIRPTIQKLREAAPQAALAFITWPNRIGSNYATGKRPTPPALWRPGPAASDHDVGYSSATRTILEGAWLEGADMVDISHILGTMYRSAFSEDHPARIEYARVKTTTRDFSKHRNIHNFVWETWYAKGGQDTIHPSALGHALIASVAARYLSVRISAAACESSRSVVAPTEAHTEAAPPPPRLPDAPDTSTSNAATGASTVADGAPVAQNEREVCFDSADRLPVPSNLSSSPSSSHKGRWRLVDEGGEKGIHKLGYASTRIGDELTIGPLTLGGQDGPGGRGQLPREGGCDYIEVSLGYLLSHRPEQGVFRLQCLGGCECSASIAPFQSQLNPFPLIDTSTRARPEYATFNATVTETTTFRMRQWEPDTCFLRVTNSHRAWRNQLRGKKDGALEPLIGSRVRVDSLALRSSDLPSLSRDWSRSFTSLNRGGAANKLFMLRLVPCFTRRHEEDVLKLLDDCERAKNATLLRSLPKVWSDRKVNHNKTQQTFCRALLNISAFGNGTLASPFRGAYNGA
jgi:uncharacterized protein YceK